MTHDLYTHMKEKVVIPTYHDPFDDWVRIHNELWTTSCLIWEKYAANSTSGQRHIVTRVFQPFWRWLSDHYHDYDLIGFIVYTDKMKTFLAAGSEEELQYLIKLLKWKVVSYHVKVESSEDDWEEMLDDIDF